MQYIKSTLVLFCLFSFNLHGELPESLYSLNTQLESIANAIKKPSKNTGRPLPPTPELFKEIRGGKKLKPTQAEPKEKQKEETPLRKITARRAAMGITEEEEKEEIKRGIERRKREEKRQQEKTEEERKKEAAKTKETKKKEEKRKKVKEEIATKPTGVSQEVLKKPFEQITKRIDAKQASESDEEREGVTKEEWED